MGQLTLDGKRVVREFMTATDAAKHVGCDMSSMARSCRDRIARGGSLWRYKAEVVEKTKKVGAEAVGRRIKVWRKSDEQYHEGIVESFDEESGRHRLRYKSDEEEETLDLSAERFRFTARATTARGPHQKGDIVKQKVEQLCPTSGQVEKTFKSVVKAAEKTGIPAKKILGVLRGDCQTAGGPCWRYRGTAAMPAGAKSNGEIEVEKMCPDTCAVLGACPSLSEAARANNLTPSIVCSVINGRAPRGGGYFWRYRGSEAQPRKLKHTKTVQQLCLETGQVLATFPSLAAAANAVGISHPSISNICNAWAGHASAGGFGWRFAVAESDPKSESAA